MSATASTATPADAGVDPTTEQIADALGDLGAGARAVGRRRRSARVLGLAFLGAGVNHFLMPRAYARIVPPSLKRLDTEVVAASGVAEIACGLGVLLPRTRRAAGIGTIALLAAVFPANLYMARAPQEFRRIPRWALYARLPLQPLMMWWAWSATGRRSARA
jgi:uncharacterized membrane protein